MNEYQDQSVWWRLSVATGGSRLEPFKDYDSAEEARDEFNRLFGPDVAHSIVRVSGLA